MMKPHVLYPTLLSLLLAAPFAAALDNIQFKSVDFTTSVIELHNFAKTDQSLNGWRFCSHDDNQPRRYSSPSGMNGVTVPAGESVFYHFLNDAGGQPGHLDISSVGGNIVALPLDRGPYAIQIYFPPISFGNGNTIGDHLQWNIDGVDNDSADGRSIEAQNGGVWINQNAWISTTATTARLELNDESGGRLHGPDDYTAIEPLPEFLLRGLRFEGNGDISLLWDDLSAFGVTSYSIEMSEDLGPGSWVPASPATSATNSVRLTGPFVGRRFFRILAN